MRCDDLTRELASPTGAHTPAELAGHLAHCPGCAEWSRQAARFDRIWEATRPVEPSSTTMDALWARASAALEAQPVPATLRLTPRRAWLKPALLLAQAAALLLAAGVFLSRTSPVDPPQVAIQTPVVDPKPVETFEWDKLVANEGETLLVSIPVDLKKADPKVIRVNEVSEDHSTSIPSGTPFEVFNAAEPMVASAS